MNSSLEKLEKHCTDSEARQKELEEQIKAEGERKAELERSLRETAKKLKDEEAAWRS